MDNGDAASLIWASIVSIAESDDQDVTDPEVVENELGNPETLTACRWSPSYPVYRIEPISEEAE